MGKSWLKWYFRKDRIHIHSHAVFIYFLIFFPQRLPCMGVLIMQFLQTTEFLVLLWDLWCKLMKLGQDQSRLCLISLFLHSRAGFYIFPSENYLLIELLMNLLPTVQKSIHTKTYKKLLAFLLGQVRSRR